MRLPSYLRPRNFMKRKGREGGRRGKKGPRNMNPQIKKIYCANTY
jgi:hypothetical protein